MYTCNTVGYPVPVFFFRTGYLFVHIFIWRCTVSISIVPWFTFIIQYSILWSTFELNFNMNVYTVTHAVMCPGSWKSGCELLFLLFLVYLVVLSFNILLGCVYTLNIHDIHECSVVCTYMCWCTHTRNGMHTTAHKQHTPCREEPFFYGRCCWNNRYREEQPMFCQYNTVDNFFVANIQNMPMSRISRCNWVYEQHTFNTNTCKHHHISYYSLGGKNNAKTIVWNIRGHLMLECFSLCNVVAGLSYGGRR